MNYTLNQLQVFLKITQTESVTRAAEELHLSQPAVSIQLKNLQDQFEIPLTEVVGRRIHVTDFGKEIARLAENILQQVETINYRAQSYKGLLTGRLKLSVVSTGKYMMPYFLAPFLKKHTGVQLHMDVTNRLGVIDNVLNNVVDFALVSILPAVPVVEKLDIVENKLYLVGAGDAPARKKPMPKAALSDLPLILREEGSGTRLAMEEFITRNRLSINRRMELTSNEAVKQAVMAGLGYSVMPHIGIKRELQHGDLRIIPVAGLPIRNTWRLIWPKGKQHSPVAAAFLEFVRKEKEGIIERQFEF